MMIELIGPAGEVVNVFFDKNNPNHKKPTSVLFEQDNPLADNVQCRMVDNNMAYVYAINPVEAMAYFHDAGYRAVSEEADWLETGEWTPGMAEAVQQM